jgi:hypothetical protein
MVRWQQQRVLAVLVHGGVGETAAEADEAVAEIEVQLSDDFLCFRSVTLKGSNDGTVVLGLCCSNPE